MAAARGLEGVEGRGPVGRGHEVVDGWDTDVGPVSGGWRAGLSLHSPSGRSRISITEFNDRGLGEDASWRSVGLERKCIWII